MAATPGNQWWKLAPTIGRDKIFNSPQQLWECCLEYFEETDKVTMDRADWVGGVAKQVTRKYNVPYTKTGLYVFLDIDKKTWDNYGKLDSYKEFFPIVTRVNQIIETNQLSGATVGLFNATIVSRLNSLVDRQDVTSGDEPMKAQIVVQDKSTAENLEKL